MLPAELMTSHGLKRNGKKLSLCLKILRRTQRYFNADVKPAADLLFFNYFKHSQNVRTISPGIALAYLASIRSNHVAVEIKIED